ncbi:MAG TPA: alpha/beta fold hydrolase [Dehalococcoidia bacterium]|nr:alpha/beta fold hydrolase [Dehalococcoidia bacterium]
MADGLLLLHAFPLDASMWEPQVAAFKDRLPVAAPDFPGLGGGSDAPEVMTMDAAADAGIRAMDAAGIEKAVVCGLSMGGYAALAFWRNHRDRVAGLVLANTRSGADDEAGKERRKALADRLKAEGSQFLVDGPPPLLSGEASEELWGRVKGIIAKQSAAGIAGASLGMGARPDYTDDLAGIDVPVLVITSTGDTLIPADATKPMASQIPNAQLEVIEGAGHLTNIEATEEFNRLLGTHLVKCGVLAG